MKLIKINGEVLGVITNDKLAQSLNLSQALSPSGDPSDGPEIVDLGDDFVDDETGMSKTLGDYLNDGFVVDGALLRVENDKDVFQMLTSDGRSYRVGVD